MSSDSEDDCYGNITQRLQTVKSTFKEDKIDSTNLLIELKEKEFTDNSWKKNDVSALDYECGTSQNRGTEEEISLDAIIAKNSKKRANRAAKRTAEVDIANFLPKKKPTLDGECGTSKNSGTAELISLDSIKANNSNKRALRAAKRAAQIDTPNIVPKKKTRAKRGKKNSAKDTASASQGPTAVPQVPELSESELSEPENPGLLANIFEPKEVLARAIACGSFREPRRPIRWGPKGTGTRVRPFVPEEWSFMINSRIAVAASSAMSNRTQAQANGHNPSNGRSSNSIYNGPTYSVGNTAEYPDKTDNQPLFSSAPKQAVAASSAMSNRTQAQAQANGHNPSNRRSSNSIYNGPTYSVGNTAEYPDKSDNQPLFSSAPKPKPQNDVVIIDIDQDLDEELSIKVFWQSSEVVKFNLRPFQRLTPIFDHFASREKIPHDKLLFTYNNKILKSGDTPHSINYSIVKFIDGGIINQSVSSLIQDSIEEGIKLKFQCKNVRRPFLASIQANEKMQIVMMKCAEHLEKPLNKLKFYFDGDLISDSDTPTELELEGGECIDVHILI